MTHQLTITYFPNSTPLGMDLLDAFRAYAAGAPIALTIKLDAAQSDFFRACVKQDVVIFDGSIEDGVYNYAIATAQPMGMAHVLVVSRTYLPINFEGVRTGGTPDYPHSMRNEEILTWLKEQIVEMQNDGLIPRPWLHKNALGSLASVWTSMTSVQRQRGQQNLIFLSYRSRYYEDEQFKELIRQIDRKESCNGETRTPKYFPPEQLSMGFMTEQERWQLLEYILRWVSASREVWVYETEDYYRSWWTLAELVMLAYLRQRHDGRGPRLRIYNKKADSLDDAPDNYLPVMTYEQRRRMDRYMSVSDRRTMAPETDARMRQLARGKWTHDIDYFHDHAFSESFGHDLILDCFACDEELTSLDGFDYDDFLYLRGDYFTRLSSEAVTNMIDERGNGMAICSCGIEQHFVVAAPQYIWWPTRMGKATGPDGNAIEERTSYQFMNLQFGQSGRNI